jgi:hypothetical protein
MYRHGPRQACATREAVLSDVRNSMPEEGRIDEFTRHMAVSSLDAIRLWLKPFGEKFYSYGYTMMFMKLIATPGIKKSELRLFLQNEALISHSTAERFINLAAAEGYINIGNPKNRPGLEITLSDELLRHFKTAFLDAMARGAKRLETYGDLAPREADAASPI